ncbi:MAG: NlpC/P60 family protein [Nanobdellota archaeon]
MVIFNHSKRGFMTLLFSLAFLLLMISLIVVYTSDDSSENIDVGRNAYRLLLSDQKATSTQSFIDSAIELSVDQSFDNFMEYNGMYYEQTTQGPKSQHPCGDYIYPIIYSTNQQQSCIPSYQENYKEYLNTKLEKTISSHPEQSFSFTPAVSFQQQGGSTEISITSRDPIRILFNSSEQTTSAQSKQHYSKGPLGGYGNETIIPCANVTCLVDIADFYHSYYPQFDYVVGGESPYSYEHTTALQEKNTGSFFSKDVVITRMQEGRSAFTTEGFDSSGWLWWVGKHADCSLFQTRKSTPAYYKDFQEHPDIEKICSSGGEASCSKEFLAEQLQSGDILFYKQQGDVAPSHMMLYVGEGKVSHSRQSTGLVKESLPSSYKNNIDAVFRIKESTFTGSAQTLLDHFTKDSQDVEGSCVLPIDFTQLNEDAIKHDRISFGDLQSSVDKHELNTAIAEASDEYGVPEAYIKAIITVEVGSAGGIDAWLSGEKTVSESEMRGPMQLSTSACDTLNQNSEDSCNLNIIEDGDVVYAIKTSTRFIAHLIDTSTYIDSANPNYYLLSLAYNAGPGSLKYVVRASAERNDVDPETIQWADISYEDISNGLKKVEESWSNKESKWDEVYEYPNLVARSLSEQCIGNPFLSNQKNHLKLDIDEQQHISIDFSFLQQSINDFSRQLESITNNLPSTVKSFVYNYNEGVQEARIASSANAVSSPELFRDSIIKQLLDCSTNEQSGCVCKIETNTSKLSSDVTFTLRWESYLPSDVTIYDENDNHVGKAHLLPLSIKHDDGSTIPQQLTFTFKEDGTILVKDSSSTLLKEKYSFALLKHFSYEDYTTTNYHKPLVQATIAQHSEDESGDSSYFADMFDSTLDSFTSSFDISGLETFDISSQDQTPSTTEDSSCQSIADTANKYLGTGYGGTGSCSPAQAKKEKCTTQCGSFVTNVFRYTESFDAVYGDGNKKCTPQSVSSNTFLNPELLRPGDIFSSDGRSQAAQQYGHAGIYVGRGEVSDVAKTAYTGNPYCHETFTPDPDGEHVFIHSVGPVCYSTLSELIANDIQGRNIITFCRHNNCVKEDSTQNISSLHAQSGMTMTSYNSQMMDSFACREPTDTFLFSLETDSLSSSLQFAVELNDSVPPDKIDSVSTTQYLCNQNPAIMFQWSDENDEDIYAYNLTVRSDDGSKNLTYFIPVSQAVSIEYIGTQTNGFTSTSSLRKMFSFKTLHQLKYTEDDSTSRQYYYTIGNTGSTPLFENQSSYTYELSVMDHHLNVQPQTQSGSFTVIIDEITDVVVSAVPGLEQISYASNMFSSGQCTNYLNKLDEDREVLLGIRDESDITYTGSRPTSIPAEDIPADNDFVKSLIGLEGHIFIVEDRYGELDWDNKQTCDSETCTLEDVEVLKDLDDSGGINCFDSTTYAYKKVGQDFPGFEFCLNDSITESRFDDSCSNTDDITKGMLSAGDIISMNWEGINHNVVFLGWADKANNEAYLLNWVGKPSYANLPSTFTNAFDNQQYSTLLSKNTLKSFRTETYTLKFDESNEEGMVYAIT